MTTKADIWMPLYIADYLADTAYLTTEQSGAYLHLLMAYWRNGPPPDNDGILASITKLPPDAWSITRAVLVHYFEVCDGRWIHRRVERELDRAKVNREKSHARAVAGAKARWGKADNQDGMLEALPESMLKQCPSPSPSPSTTKSTADQKPGADAPVVPTLDLDGHPTPSRPGRQADVDDVFAHWCTTLGHPQAKLTDDRRKLISKALGWGYSVDQLREAIDGCAMTPHNMGINDRGQRYDGLHIILRSGDQIDRFIGNNKNPPRAGDWNRKIQQGAASVNEFVNGGAQ